MRLLMLFLVWCIPGIALFTVLYLGLLFVTGTFDDCQTTMVVTCP